MQKANINGLEIAYTRRGQGYPLVLVHGYPLTHSIWDEVVSLLENKFDIITPDLRGFGESEVVTSQYKILDMADDIAGLLTHLGIEKTLISGHSMGGYVSLAFARAFPERVVGLGLVASQAIGDTPEGKAGRYKAADDILASGVQPVADMFPAKLTPNEQVQARARNLIAAQKPVALAGALKAMAERDDSFPILSRFEFPVVIIHGDQDALIPIQRAKDIKAEIPHAEFVEMNGIGHMPMMEAPETVAQALKKVF